MSTDTKHSLHVCMCDTLATTQGVGLSEREKRICDMFVFIPQYGHGTASLNVSVAAGIVLHHFAVWAKYPEQARINDKFVVDPLAVVGRQSGAMTRASSTSRSTPAGDVTAVTELFAAELSDSASE
jgi:tRNA C32,U32 (ribose-2'-O)-methylase TrmJ